MVAFSKVLAVLGVVEATNLQEARPHHDKSKSAAHPQQHIRGKTKHEKSKPAASQNDDASLEVEAINPTARVGTNATTYERADQVAHGDQTTYERTTTDLYARNYARTDEFAHGDKNHQSGLVEKAIHSYASFSISEYQEKKFPAAAKALSMPGGLSWCPDKTCVAAEPPTNATTHARRTAYLLTVNEHTPRAVQSRKVLEGVGFDVKILHALPIDGKVIRNGYESNKQSNIKAMKEMAQGPDPWYYLLKKELTNKNFRYLLCEQSIITTPRLNFFFVHHSAN